MNCVSGQSPKKLPRMIIKTLCSNFEQCAKIIVIFLFFVTFRNKKKLCPEIFMIY